MESGTRLRISWVLLFVAIVQMMPWKQVHGRQQCFAMPPVIPKGPIEIEINRSVVEDKEFSKKFPYENAMLEISGKNRMPDYNTRINFVACQKTKADGENRNVPGTKDAKDKPSYMEKLRNEFNMAMRQMALLFVNGSAKDTGNERMRVFDSDSCNSYYEGGLDALKSRSGKGFLIEKTGDDSYLGGWCKNYRQAFGIEIKFRAGNYHISAGMYQAGERLCKVPIPCQIRAKLADLKNTTDRRELFKCVLVMLPIAQCVKDPESLLGITTDDEKDRLEGMKSGLFHDEGGDAKTIRINGVSSFSCGIPKGPAEKPQTNYADFKTTLSNSKTFVFSTDQSFNDLCVQLYSLTPEYAPEFKIYSVHRTLNDPTNSNKMHFIEIKDCAQGSGSDSKFGQSKVYRTIKTEANKLYLIDVGIDPVKITEDEYTIQFKRDGNFMVYFDLGKNPLYNNLFGSAYESVCVGDWKYKVIFNPGGQVTQYLPQSHQQTQYLCGILDLTLAPYVDMRCDSITFYYTQGNKDNDLKKRLTSLQLKSGVGNWKGWTNEEPKLHYKISNIDKEVINVINPLKLLLKISISHQGQTVYSGTVITDENCTATPAFFTPLFDRCRKFLFNPQLSGRYCIMLVSCSPSYFPSMRIYTCPSENKKEYTQLMPQFYKNTAFYDLCSGEDYLAEVGIDPIKTIKVTQSEEGGTQAEALKQRKEAFMIIYSTEVKDYFEFFNGKTYKPSAPSNVNYNTDYEITLNPRNEASNFIKKTVQNAKTLGVYEPQIAPYFDHKAQSISFFFPSNAHDLSAKLRQPYGTLELRITSPDDKKPNGFVSEVDDGFPVAVCPEVGITDLLSLTAKAKNPTNK